MMLLSDKDHEIPPNCSSHNFNKKTSLCYNFSFRCFCFKEFSLEWCFRSQEIQKEASLSCAEKIGSINVGFIHTWDLQDELQSEFGVRHYLKAGNNIIAIIDA